MGFFSNLWNGIKNTVSNVYNKGKSAVSGLYNNYIKPTLSKIPLVGNLATGAIEGLGNSINTAASAVGNLAESKLKEFGKNALKTGIDFIGSKVPLVGGMIGNVAKNAVDRMKKGGMVMGGMAGGDKPYVMHDGMPRNVYQR
jgi:phage-related protein